MKMDNKCTLCPRNCGANRKAGQKGYCGAGAEIRVARAALHYGEEPCISGIQGSGTVFFSGCSLHCVYCQNQIISQKQFGQDISIERLSKIFLELQAQKAHNLNLVTGGHFLPQIKAALQKAKEQGLTIPVIYNSGGYEKVDNLKALAGLVDIYLPDLKYYAPELSQRYSQAADYFSLASSAIGEMFRQVGSPFFAANGILQKGLLVRHLLLPGQLADSKQIIRYLWTNYGNSIWLSLMNQFTPIGDLSRFPELQAALDPAEYEELLSYALNLGIEQAFIQEEGAAGWEYIPDFDLTGV